MKEREDPCVPLIGLERPMAERCVVPSQSVDQWQVGGVYRVDGKVYSVAWLDHGHHEVSSAVNWCPDTVWTREVLVFEHPTGDLSTPSEEDPLAFRLRLQCEQGYTFDPLPLPHCDPRSPAGWSVGSEGDAPLPAFPFSCGPWPGELEAVTGQITFGECYASRLCPLGTVCYEAQVVEECPAAGSTCLSPSSDEVDDLVICEETPPLECVGCGGDEDCPVRSTCGGEGLCERVEEVAVDFRADCSGSGPANVKAEALPAGTYRITALRSAGSLWTESYWIYTVPCQNLTAPNLITPPGMLFPSADDAFENLLAISQEVNFEGGDLTCGVADGKCEDNSGAVRFRVELLCPSCGDGILSGDESDVDCGGTACGACAVGETCLAGDDCETGICDEETGVCIEGDCEDGVANGEETGVDCGGPSCDPCGAGQGCEIATDCESAVCDTETSLCAAPTCGDAVRNGDETGIDCGGTNCHSCELDCPGCAAEDDCPEGSACGEDGFCERVEEVYIDWATECSPGGGGHLKARGLPPGTYRITALPSAGSYWDTSRWLYEITCDDLSVPGVATPPGGLYPNVDEVFANLVSVSQETNFVGGDLFCGARDAKCDDNHGGVRFRLELVCPSCGDGILSGDESDVDCGGTACASCLVGQDCFVDEDCDSGVCHSETLQCSAPTCGDEVHNGDETDIDCGGATCDPCAVGEGCASGDDCESGVCSSESSLCLAPTCEDGVLNGEETWPDCGGPECPACLRCQECIGDEECYGGGCGVDGRCARIEEIAIDWVTDCGSPAPSHVMASDLPAGTYRITALDSAATTEAMGGWVYTITCENLTVATVATPGGASYDSAAEAFANLEAATEDVPFDGGDLVCGVEDSTCGNNRGSILFRMEHLCALEIP